MSGWISLLVEDGITKGLTEKIQKMDSVLLKLVGDAGKIFEQQEAGSGRSKFWKASVVDQGEAEMGFSKLLPKKLKRSVYSMRYWSRISNIAQNLKRSPEKRKYILNDAAKEFKKSSALQNILDNARDEIATLGTEE